MFGYVIPCKMELKVKDYEKFKSYYCGLCLSIKKQYGNLPRMVLNYDMTFLAILLDSLTLNKPNYQRHTCILHPLKKKVVIKDNSAINYAAFCNVILTYYKLIDNINDDGSIISNIGSFFLKGYFGKNKNEKLNSTKKYIEKSLKDLSQLENSNKDITLDEICHPFGDLTGYIISSYVDNLEMPLKDITKENLYWLGYNLGKWIYIIDAIDDLKEDMEKKKINVINKLYNEKALNYEEFYNSIKDRIEFSLLSCATNCADNLNKLALMKNDELLENILQYGLMERMDIVFKRSELVDAKSL